MSIETIQHNNDTNSNYVKSITAAPISPTQTAQQATQQNMEAMQIDNAVSFDYVSYTQHTKEPRRMNIYITPITEDINIIGLYYWFKTDMERNKGQTNIGSFEGILRVIYFIKNIF